MSHKTRLMKLERQQSELILIVVDSDETNQQAIQRWCDQTGMPKPDNVLTIKTGVPSRKVAQYVRARG